MDPEATPETVPSPTGNIDTDAGNVLALLDAEESAQPETQDAPETKPETDSPAPKPEAESEPAAEPEEPPKYRVKVRGEEREVTLDELQRGYSRTEDYKAKTAEAAELRRTAEAERQAIQAERQRYADNLNHILNQARVMDPVLAEAQKIDWAQLAKDDPAGYVAKKADVEQRMANYQFIEAEKNRAQAESLKLVLEREQAALTEAIPEWSDPEKRSALAKDLYSAGEKHYKFTKQELAAVYDHRMLTVLADASKWQKHLASQEAAKAKRVPPAPAKVVKPSGQNVKADSNPRLDALKTRAKRTGKVDDTVAFVMSAIRDEA